MITGTVRRHEAVIPLTVRDSGNREVSLEAVVDAGFTGELCLPRALIVQLGLAWWRSARGRLADGSETLFEVYRATLDWDGVERTVAVDDVNAPPMIGMRLLNGSELNIEVRTGGSVSIQTLPVS